MKRCVYVAFHHDGYSTALVNVYSKTSYQKAYNWLADIAEKHGNQNHPTGLKYPNKPVDGEIILSVHGAHSDNSWWLECHEIN